MLIVLKNNRAACMEFPATADPAYLIANDWMSSTVRACDSRGVIARGAVFMLDDDGRVLAIVHPTPLPPKDEDAAQDPSGNPSGANASSYSEARDR